MKGVAGWNVSRHLFCCNPAQRNGVLLLYNKQMRSRDASAMQTEPMGAYGGRPDCAALRLAKSRTQRTMRRQFGNGNDR
jgi:hypothetical protein